MADKIQQYLDEAECHFKWRPEQEDKMPEDIQFFKEKILNYIIENEKIELFGLSLLSYVLAKGNELGGGINYEKAIQYANEAIAKSTCKGEELVAMTNKMHIYHQTEKSHQVEQLYCDIMESQQNLTQHDHCRIKLTHAFALTCFGMKSFFKSLDIYKDVLQIDNLSADGHFGFGMILGRIRRYRKTTNSKPCEEEVNALLRACELQEWKHPVSIVWYGYAKVQLLLSEKKSRDLESSVHETVELLEKAVKLADEQTDSSCTVYKWCAKGYRKLSKLSLPFRLKRTLKLQQKECVDKAIKANPKDSAALHEAGIFYWKTYYMPKQPEDYLEQACRYTTTGNFWADVDLTKFRKRHDRHYDAVSNYTFLLEKYKERESGMDSQLNLANLHMLIGEEFIDRGDRVSAVTEFVQAIELDKKLQIVRQAKYKVKYLLHEKLEGNNKRGKTEAQLPLLLQLGHVSYITGDFAAAKNYYENVLTVDDSSSTAKERLCEVYYRLSNYEDCIQMGCSVVEILPSVRQYVAMSYYRDAESHFDHNLNTAKELLWKSAEFGLLEAGQKLLEIIKKECSNNKEMSLTQYVYEECVKICHGFSGTLDVVSLPEEYKEVSSGELLEQAKELSRASRELIMKEQESSDLHPDLYEKLKRTRNLRFEMTLMKMSAGSPTCMDVLSEARCQLNGCFVTFIESQQEFQSVQRGYYPFTPKAKNTPSESEENLQETIPFIKEKLEVDMNLVNFSTLLPELFDFLCKRQASYSSKYGFVPDFWEIASNNQHESTDDEQKEYCDLAHKACIYVEELAIELSKYMPSP